MYHCCRLRKSRVLSPLRSIRVQNEVDFVPLAYTRIERSGLNEVDLVPLAITRIERSGLSTIGLYAYRTKWT